MSKVLITTIPFADKDRLPLELLENANIDYLINPLGKKLTEDELAELITDFDVVIAGTETISAKVMDRATNLKMISRVGIGLDSVDLVAAKERGITVDEIKAEWDLKKDFACEKGSALHAFVESYLFNKIFDFPQFHKAPVHIQPASGIS